MPFPGQSWPFHLKVVTTVFHVLVIVSGIFRTTYRWKICRFGWEDAWALAALVTDIGCLTGAWLDQSVPLHYPHRNRVIILNWVDTFTLTSVLWEARLSMMTAIIRITNPRGRARHLSYAIVIAFGLMWMTVLAQKFYNCATRTCRMTHNVVISQLTTDVISDILLVVTPISFLKGMRISQGQRVLLVSSFASSICITIVSIAHSIVLFRPLSSTSLLIVHIKAALSLIICNLLVILTFIYRYLRKTDIDLGGTPIDSDLVQFTTVVQWQPSLGSSHPPSLQSPSCHVQSVNMDRGDVSRMPTRVGSSFENEPK